MALLGSDLTTSVWSPVKYNLSNKKCVSRGVKRKPQNFYSKHEVKKTKTPM